MLPDTIKDIAKKIEKYKKDNIHEAGTKSGLIQPLFQKIGWDFFDIDSVEPEFPVQLDGENKPADYALKIDQKPSLLVEAKRINVKIEAAIKDGTQKALKKRVPWLIATNGDTIAVLKIDEKIPEPERIIFQIILSDVVNNEQELSEASDRLLLLRPENVTSNDLETFATKKIKKTRITNAIKEVLDSKDFLKLIQERYKELYSGDKPDPKVLDKIVGKITIASEKKEVVITGNGPKVPDSEIIRQRQERLFRYPTKALKETIKKNIIDKKELWLKFIERKQMSTKQFKDYAEFLPKATGGFTYFLSCNGLATNVDYDGIRKGAIYEINEEIIPDIKAILNVK